MSFRNSDRSNSITSSSISDDGSDDANEYYYDEFDEYMKKISNETFTKINTHIIEDDIVKLYNYYFIDNLPKKLSSSHIIENVVLCLYNINIDGQQPFIEYFMNFDSNKGKLIFPTIQFISTENCSKHLKHYFNTSIDCVYKGFVDFENNYYLFFTFTDNSFSKERNKLFDKNNCFVTTEELLNRQKIYDIEIDEVCSRFFNNYKELCILYNNSFNKTYEIPSTGYILREKKDIEFTSVFGQLRENKDNILGPYYYFNDYDNCLKRALNSKKSYGIVRNIMFLGTTKVLMNNINDSVIISQYKIDYLKRNNLNKIVLNRLTDYEGLWTNDNDSIYIGNIDLDDGSKFTEGPLWVVKNYDQFVSLDYKII